MKRKYDWMKYITPVAKRYGPYLAQYAARKVGRRLFSNSRRSSLPSRRRRMRSGQGITAQHDQRLIYRKRYMPKRRKSQWRTFVKKVKAVKDKDLGTRTYVMNQQVTQTNTDGTAQMCYTNGLYTLNGSNGLADMNDLAIKENVNDPSAHDRDWETC